MLINVVEKSLVLLLSWKKIKKAFLTAVYTLLITIDTLVYNFINLCFQVFVVLSKVRIFNDDVFSQFLRRFYVLAGVMMLFFIVYSLLKVIANPDNMTKGEYSPGKIISNIVTSLILVTILPAIFNFAYLIQDVIIDNDLIGRIVLGDTSANATGDSVKKGGRQVAVQIFSAFFYEEEGKSAVLSGSFAGGYFEFVCSIPFFANNQNYQEEYTQYLQKCVQEKKDTYAEYNPSYVDLCDGSKIVCSLPLGFIKAAIIEGDMPFSTFKEFAGDVVDDKVHYSIIICFVAGVFAAYISLCFVFDLGVRAVKLAILQIIAPIPILMRILPNKNKIFNNWVSTTIACFFEVFIRIFIVYIIALIAGKIPDAMKNIFNSAGGATEISGAVKALANAFLIMGLIAFAKQAPKMISDMFGIKSGDLGLSLANRMKVGGGFLMGSAIGAGATTAVRNLANGGKNVANKFRNAKREWNTRDEYGDTHRGRLVGGVIRAGAGMFTSPAAGAVSGAVRGAWKARKASTFSDMSSAASQGAQDAVNKRDYRDRHPMFSKNKEGKTVFTGGVIGASLATKARQVAAWATGQTTEELVKKKDIYGKLSSDAKAIHEQIGNTTDKKLDSTVVRDSNCNITMRDGKILTLGMLKQDVTRAQSEVNAHIMHKDAYIAANGEELYNLELSRLQQAASTAESRFNKERVNAINHQYKAEINGDINQQVIFDNINKMNDTNGFHIVTDTYGNQKIEVTDSNRIVHVEGVASDIKNFETKLKNDSVSIRNDAESQLHTLEKEIVRLNESGKASPMELNSINDRVLKLQTILKHLDNPNAENFMYNEYVIDPNTKQIRHKYTDDDFRNLRAYDEATLTKWGVLKNISAKSLDGAFKGEENVIEEILATRKIKEKEEKKK